MRSRAAETGFYPEVEVRPLQRRAMEEVVSNLGNLELAWTKPELRGKLMALPIDAVEQLLVGRDLQQ
ncbi:hypothetical protein HaLaN_23323 [Haematococcus lacustris]|uniref:Uncharacterized protein n=1 Tax=Haematococcus lacustris TaxID=44745 RepID=A0A699ZRV1_HAELA|nr:hypothetical protein HaLaN_23323 [Haematococcus lacustris]